MKKQKVKLTQKRLKEVLDYDPDTGTFTWKIRNSNVIKVGQKAGWQAVNGYICTNINGTSYLSHRLAFLYMEGYLPENEVDHINRIRNENRWCNLREVSRRCNGRNCEISKNNKSKITGVSWHAPLKKWAAYIFPNNKKINLGFFEHKIDAAKARWDAEKKYGWPACNTTSSAYLYLKENKEV